MPWVPHSQLSAESLPWLPPPPPATIHRPSGEPPTWISHTPLTPTRERHHDPLLTTRYFHPPPPTGTYWLNNVLHSIEQHEYEWETNQPGPPTNTIEDILPPDNNAIIKHKSRRTFDKCGVYTIITQNIHGINNGDDSKIKSLIQQMKQEQWAAVCIQETWQLGTTTYYIDDHKVIMHGHSPSAAPSGRPKKGRNKAGVCIILNPLFSEAHNRAKETTITLPAEHKFEGHFLGVPLVFPNYDNNGKRLKGNLRLLLCSVYHPHESADHSEFNNILPNIINDAPKHSEVIFGHDINCNIGVCPEPRDDLRRVLGPYGLNNRNNKGTQFLQTMCELDMKILNSFFPKQNYATYRNIDGRTYHMLDAFSASALLFKRIPDCGVTERGVASDHSAVQMKININTIRWTSHEHQTINAGKTDWAAIVSDETLNQIFNHKISTQVQSGETYSDFFPIVSEAARATATTLPEPPIDWFEHSKLKIQPAMDLVTSLLAELRDPNNPAPDDTKQQLKIANKMRNIVVREAKTSYNRLLSTKLHASSHDHDYRSFHKIIKATALGNEVNHTTKSTMSLRMPDGSRANNDKDNMTVMLPHCERMFNNHKAVSPDALDRMAQRDEVQYQEMNSSLP